MKKDTLSLFGPINPAAALRIGACYIIAVTDYLTRWAEAAAMKDCSAETAASLFF